MVTPRFMGYYARGLTLSLAAEEWGSEIDKHIDQICKYLDGSFFARLMASLHKQPKNSEEMRDHERRRETKSQLKHSILLGFGYSLPRAAGDTFSFIPPDVWDGEIDWERSTVSGNGLSFVQVRIIPLWEKGEPTAYRLSSEEFDARVVALIKAVLNDELITERQNLAPSKTAPKATSPTKKKGRANEQEICKQIFLDLAAEGLFSGNDRPKNKLFNTVAARLKERHGIEGVSKSMLYAARNAAANWLASGQG